MAPFTFKPLNLPQFFLIKKYIMLFFILFALMTVVREGMAADDFVIAADQDSILYYAKSNGDGTFSDVQNIGLAYGVSGYTRGIAMNDFNNDGHMDFVVGRGVSSTAYYYLFLNNGSNGFTMAGEVGTLSNANSHAMDMATGDFNNDGHMDFIANGNYWNTGLYLGDGKGHFSKTEMNLGNYGRGMDVADFNNDGNLDFARANYSNGYIYVHPGNGDGTFGTAVLVGDTGNDPYALAAGDFNNDGFADIMANSGSGGDPYFFAGNGDNTFVAMVYQASLDVGQHGAYDAYDYDGDGILDVVATLYSARELRFYKGIGDGTFAAHVLIGKTTNELWSVSAPPIGTPVNVPIAIISPASAAIAKGAGVDFDGTGSTDSDGTIASWSWVFGDGGTDSVENPDAHTYAGEGTYMALLKVTDNDNKAAQAFARVVVSGDAPVVDTTAVSFGEAEADNGIWTLTLDGANYATDTENTIVSYAWDFGTFTDDFEDQNVDDWTVYAGNWAVSDVDPITGLYAFEQSHATLGRTQVLNNREYYGENTVIEADVTLVSGSGEEAHLLFRGRDGDNNYEFILRGRGNNDTLLYRRINNSASNLFDYNLPSETWWTGDAADNPYPIDAGHTYHLKIVLTGTLMQFYLDGHFLFSYSDASFTSGRVGFSTYQTVAVFDNLSVRETAAGQNVTRRFGPAGTYDVGLSVTDAAGQTDTGTIAMTMAPGALPVAKAGGPYSADEAAVNGGGWTFALVDGGSSDDVEIQKRTWEFGNDTFDGTTFQGHKWFSNGNVSQSDAIDVTGVSTWDTRYLVSRATYPKVKDQIFQASIKATSGQSMLGFKNTSTSNFYYNQFPYCFYLYNGSVYIYENSNSRGDTGYDFAYDTWYDYKIELTASGAVYSYKRSDQSTWIVVYESAYTTADTELRKGMVVHSGTVSMDNFRETTAGSTPSYTLYKGTGVFDVNLTVIDRAGQRHTDTTTVTISDGADPVANAGANQTIDETGAANGTWTVGFDATGSSDDHGIYTYEWDWAYDGTTFNPSGDTGVNASHTWDVPGIYTVALRVTDHAFQTHVSTTTVTITQGNLPTADTGGPYAVNEDTGSAFEGGWSVTLDGSGSADDETSIAQYVWDLGTDTFTGTSLTAGKWYYSSDVTQDGDVTIVSATSSWGTRYLCSKDVFTRARGMAFEAKVNQVVSGNTMLGFKNTNTTNFAYNQMPYAIYFRGTEIYIYEGGSSRGDTGQTITIDQWYDVRIELKETQGALYYYRMSGDSDWILLYDSNYGTDTELRRHFDVYLGTLKIDDLKEIAAGVSPTYRFYGLGSHPVSLTVWDAAGQTDKDLSSVTIGGNDPPVADAGGDRSAGESKAFEGTWTFTFDGSGSTDDFGIYTYDWDWDNDGVYDDTGVSVSHTFSSPGTHTVNLRVTDHALQSVIDTATVTLTTGEAPTADAGPDITTEGHWPVYLNGGSSSDDLGIARYSWDFGDYVDFVNHDGPTSQGIGKTPRHLYWENGDYTVTLTVYDNAMQSDTDTAIVHVITGEVPVADAGGPYTAGAGGPPAYFNGSGSTDDYGIVKYLWDVDDQVDSDGDGTFDNDADVVGRKPFYTYATAGTYTVTLTVVDGAGQRSEVSTASVNVADNLAPNVICVPWLAGDPTIPHETYNGRSIRLKAIVRDAGDLEYRWVFGDGTFYPADGTSWAAVTNKYIIEAGHTYPDSADETPYVATLHVKDASGAIGFDSYYVIVKPDNLDTRTNIAIDEGLWWQHKKQNKSTGAFYAPSYANYSSITGSAIQAFEINGHFQEGDNQENPYVESINKGFEYLFTKLSSVATSTASYKTHGEPDSNGNGIAIADNSSRPIYQGGMIMDAIASSNNPLGFATTGGTNIKGRFYFHIMTDMVDMYAYGQVESGTARGGWQYSWHGGADNSACQWAAIGMLAAEDTFGINVPEFVKTENNDYWLQYSYGGTGFGYTGPGNGVATTPSGMVQMAFCDAYTTDPRWRTAEDYIANNWFWQNNNYYGIYALVKALRLARPYPVTTLQATGLDWFNDGTTGVKKRLVDAQGVSGDNWGSWDSAGHGDRGYDTAWAIIMLTPSLFVQPPVADAGDNVIWAFDTELVFDASGSFHMDGARSIVKYEWDFNGDGVYDFTTTNPADPNARYTYADPNPNEPGDVPQHFTVRLRVTDDNEPPQTDIDTREVEVAEPPHAPFARHGGPYIATAGIPFILDGSRSFDVDSGDSITLLFWDLDNDGVWFDDIDLETAKKKESYTYATPGVYQIGLKVRDNGVFNPVGCTPGVTCTPLVSTPVYTTVTVFANLPPVADAGGPYVIDEGDSLTLDGSGSSDPNGDSISLAWDLDNDGDFDDSTSETPSFSWDDNGAYTVRLKVTDSLDENIDTITVTVNDKGPSASFTLTPESQAEGLSVSFTDTSTSSPDVITGWLWDFGGQGTSQVQNPVFTFGNNGSYLVALTITDEDGSTDSVSHTVTITDRAPTAAVSGPATLGDQVSGTYSAAGSTSSPDTIVLYEWDWDYNGVAFVPSSDKGVSSVHTWMAGGSHTVAVRVTDDDGSVDIATLVVTVSDNSPTAAVSGPLTLDEGDPGTYDASGSTSSPDAIVSYEWDWNYNGTTFAPSGDTGVSFAHTWLVSGSHTVAVRVRDDDGSVDIATLVVTVNDKEPVARLSGPVTVDERESITYDASGSTSGPNPIVSYEWDWNYNGTTFTPSGDTGVSFAHTWEDSGSYIVAVRVNDDDGFALATLAVTVNPANAAPELINNKPLALDEDSSATITSAYLRLEDMDGDPITYQLVMKPGCGELQKNGSLLLIGNTFTQADIDAGLITYTHSLGSCLKDSFSFVANDGKGGLVDLTVFNIVINIVNPPPVAVDDPDRLTAEDTAFTGDLSPFASADAHTYAIVRYPNKGKLSLNTGTGTYTYTPHANINGLDSFMFRVRDVEGLFSNNATVSIRITPVNDAPIAYNASVTTRINAFSPVFLKATDPDGDQLTYIFDAATDKGGTLTGSPPNLMYQPPADWIGTDTIRFKANDSTVDSNTAVITITVEGDPIPNEIPVALAHTFTTAEDSAFNGTLTGTDKDGDTITFKIVSNPPKGAVQITNAATGRFTYTPKPNVNGTDSFSFKVNDGKVDSLAAIVTIIITPVNDVPVISGTPGITARLGVAYSFKPFVSNPDGDALVYSIANQPSWAVFSAATGLLSGTPGQGDIGTTKGIVISVSDGIDIVSLPAFDLTVLGTIPVTQISPAPGIYNNDTDVTLIRLDDNTGGESRTHYTLDGTVPTTASAVYDAPLHITASTTINYFSTNDNGTEPAQTAVYEIDKIAPLLSNITIVKPAGSDGEKAVDFTVIQGTAVDNESGVAIVEIKVTNGTVFLGETSVSGSKRPVLTSKETWVKATRSGSSWSYNATGVEWPPGGYTITVRVTDRAGNATLYTRFFTYIDETAMAYTELSMTLSSHTILSDGLLTIQGRLVRLPDIGLDMAGLPITLTITAPDTTIATLQAKTHDVDGHYRFENIAEFDQEGQYLITARFAGIDNVFAASLSSDRLLVGNAAGYAILIEGKKGSAGQLSYNLTANRIYDHLLKRGFHKDNIRYFNHDASQPQVNEVPVKERVKWAIETWVVEKMNGSPAPLYIIFVDHGDIETLYLNDDVTITPSELSLWLSALERSLVPSALAEKRIVILGSCYSGSFIPALSGAGRVIVTSSAEDEESYKGTLEGIDPVNQEPIRVGEFFLEELFNGLGQGSSLQAAFTTASDKTRIFTRRGGQTGNSRFFDNAMQHPLLDDNGDGAGSSHLSGNDQDGAVSQHLYLGIGSDQGSSSDQKPADILGLTGTIYLSAWQSSALLWGSVSDNSRVSAAWVEIRDPGKTLTSTGGTGQLVNDLPKLLMTLSPGGRWETGYDNFIASGKYEAFYYVRDLTTQTVSPMYRSLFYKNKLGNTPPGAFSLVRPLSTQEAVSTVAVFDWTDAIDPDGDPVTYNLIIAKDSGFKTIAYRASELGGSSTYVDSRAALSDRTTYYWRVEAVDAYGAVTPCTQAKSFYTNDTAEIPGIIKGYVYSTENYAILPGAVVTGTGGKTATVNQDGSFVMALPQGQVRLTGTHGGYEETTGLDVALLSGRVTNVFIGMTPNGYIAKDADYTIDEDEPLSGTLTAIAPDNAPISFEVVEQPQAGSLTIESTGGFTYTPAPNVHGRDSFTFRVKNGAVISNTARVTLYVESVNDAPVLGTTYTQTLTAIAADNQGSMGLTIVDLLKLSVTDADVNASQGIAITDQSTSVGSWQYSLDKGVTWKDLGSLAAGATLLASNNATRVRFVPTASGTASFTFRAWDRTSGASGNTGVDVSSTGGSTAFSDATGTVSIQTLPVNHKPVAAPSTLLVIEDTPAVGHLSGSDPDNDSLTYRIVTQPAMADAWLVDNKTGVFRYTPHQNALGTDSFTFRVNDGRVDSEPAVVTITIQPVNDAPIADNALFTAYMGVPITFDLPAKDPDNDPLFFRVVDAPQKGGVYLVGGKATYTAREGSQNTTDSFSFIANDGQADSNIATVIIQVNRINTAPVSYDSAFILEEDTSLSGILKGTDADGDALKFSITANPGKGTVNITNRGTGSFFYTPHANAFGQDSFRYKVDDGMAGSAVATVSLTITGINDPPGITASPKAYAVSGTPYSVAVTATDPDNDTLVFSVQGNPAWLTLTPNAGSATLAGTPAATDIGVYRGIVISVTDGTYTTSLPGFDLRVVGDDTAPITWASLAEGVYNGPRTVKLACNDPEAAIYFTVDGTDPTVSSTLYTGSILIEATTRLKFFARDADGNNEAIRTVSYTIDTIHPAIAITDPLNDTTVEQLPWIKGSASDQGSNITRIDLQITSNSQFFNGNGQLTRFPVWLSADFDEKTGDWEYYSGHNQWQADVTYSISARVTDAAGNQTIVNSLFVYSEGVVQQALTRLTMEVSAQAILQDQALTVTGKFSRLPDTAIDLSGRRIDLNVMDPEGDIVAAYHTQTYDRYGHYRFNGVGGFTARGEYTLAAAFTQTPLLTGSTASAGVQVKSGSGYAILVQGVTADAQGFASYAKSAGQIYKSLKNKGFTDESIYYLTHEINAGDDIPTVQGMGQAIETWARTRIETAPAPLYVILVGHGTHSAFYLNGPSETISPTQLNEWLNNLKAGLGTSLSQESQVILLGSSGSGSFIPALTAPGRVVVTSCDAGEMAVKGPLENDGRVSDLFLEDLFKEMEKGLSLKASFLTAAERIKLHTQSNNPYGDSRYADGAIQHPLLDDNGDGRGSNRLLYGEGDGETAGQLYLGTGKAPAPPDIIQVTDTQYLGLDQVSADLWMKSDADNQADAWVEIRSPGKVLNPKTGYEHRTIDFGRQTMPYRLLKDQWDLTWGGFTDSGKYELFYYVKKTGDKERFSMKRSIVYKNRYGNTAPNSFALAAPADGGEQTTQPVFDWQRAVDPQGDKVTYNLIIATDESFHNIVLRKEEIAFAPFRIEDHLVLKDLTRYYWKIEAVDEFGSVTQSAPWQFHTDNTNGFHAFIIGQIKNASDLKGIVDAAITYDSYSFGGSQNHPGNIGGYYVSYAAGTYPLVVNAAGFMESVENITGIELRAIKHDVYLTPALGNNAPVISGIPDQTIFENSATGPIPFTLADIETAVDKLVITVQTSNAGLVPANQIMISGTGANRTVTITPLANTYGKADISITVTDEDSLVTTRTFVLTVKGLNVKGDLNRDGKVDLEDALLGLKSLSGQKNTADAATDVDGDGKITIKDIIYIIQQIK